MQIGVIEVPTRKTLLVQKIEEQILSGKLRVGDPLPSERQLQEETHISKTVIHAALVELEQKGFLEITPRRGAVVANYAESEAILERLFPKDKAILLMCGAGGYAGMTRNLLVGLGWNGDMIINVGGYWDYSGDRSLSVLSEDSGDGLCGFNGTEFYDIDFTHLTPAQ